MKGIIALIFGIIALISGTFCLVPPVGFSIITIVSWLIASLLGTRAWRNNRQVVGLIGFILGSIGFFEMLIAIALAYF